MGGYTGQMRLNPVLWNQPDVHKGCIVFHEGHLWKVTRIKSYYGVYTVYDLEPSDKARRAGLDHKIISLHPSEVAEQQFMKFFCYEHDIERLLYPKQPEKPKEVPQINVTLNFYYYP